LEINNAQVDFSIANFKCTPSDRQMYAYADIYPRLGPPELDGRAAHPHTVRLTRRLQYQFTRSW